MKKIANSLTELIGHTPLLALRSYEKKMGLKAHLVAKLEYFNPAGSAKDRVALSMILDAEQKGLLHPGDTIIEPTSGNTGVGLAFVSAVRGYKLILTMPDTMSRERQALLKAYGARVELTPGEEGMKGSIDRANCLKEEIPGAIILQQFENPSNPMAHYNTTAEEIWMDTDGEMDIFVATIGTGGTLSGTGRRLKEKDSKIKVVGVEPASSPLLTKGYAGPHEIQGIGANFVPQTYAPEVTDEIMDVENDEAILASRQVACQEGLLVGISSGAALHAATQLALREENAGKTIVVLFPDSGERYLSTVLYDTESRPL